MLLAMRLNGLPESLQTERDVMAFWNTLLSQLVALLTFFAFPAFQYLLLKRFAKRQGRPELWYLPAYGFRLVIHNISGKRTLTNVKYHSIIREVVPAGSGADVATWMDTNLSGREDFFLFPGSDQVLVSFKLERKQDGMQFVHTTKLGAELLRLPLSDGSTLIADYAATVRNPLNFDIKLAKRVEVKAQHLREIYQTIETNDVEQVFGVSRVRDVT
jgi:hypothetical protein